MAITYTWAITGLTKDTAGTVVKVDWKKTGTNQNGVTAVFNMSDDFNDGDPSSDSYIAFDSLTEADVTSWIQNRVIGKYQLDVDYQIQRQIQEKIDSADVTTSAPMPWAPEEEVPG